MCIRANILSIPVCLSESIVFAHSTQISFSLYLTKNTSVCIPIYTPSESNVPWSHRKGSRATTTVAPTDFLLYTYISFPPSLSLALGKLVQSSTVAAASPPPPRRRRRRVFLMPAIDISTACAVCWAPVRAWYVCECVSAVAKVYRVELGKRERKKDTKEAGRESFQPRYIHSEPSAFFSLHIIPVARRLRRLSSIHTYYIPAGLNPKEMIVGYRVYMYVRSIWGTIKLRDKRVTDACLIRAERINISAARGASRPRLLRGLKA